jgi:hypothetical protein
MGSTVQWRHPDSCSNLILWNNSTYPETTSISLSLFWYTNISSVNKIKSHVLQKPIFHYHIYNNPPLSISCTRLINSINSHPISLRFILILSSSVCLGHLSHRNPVCNYFLPHTKCPAHILPFELSTWIRFGEENEYWSSSLHSFCHFPVISFH